MTYENCRTCGQVLDPVIPVRFLPHDCAECGQPCERCKGRGYLFASHSWEGVDYDSIDACSWCGRFETNEEAARFAENEMEEV